METLETDVLVVGAGPAGAAAAAWCARSGLETLLVDAAEFPRDKPCGDGLTPRAIAEMRRLGMADWLQDRPANWGLRAHGFGKTWHLPWPGGSMPATGSAAARTELDAAILDQALTSGAQFLPGARIVAVDVDHRLRGVEVVTVAGSRSIRCRRAVIADGARSPVGRMLGREWHRETVYGVAARGYVKSMRSDDPWISSHLELRGADDGILSGYGWIFPLGDGQVNIGVGTLATDRRPADVNLRKLLQHYFAGQQEEWQLLSTPEAVRSALLPMGGAVSGVAGPNWTLIGDAAGCVNPLNGEGIDYGLETGRLTAELFAAGAGVNSDISQPWIDELSSHYGSSFSVARRLAGLLTQPELLRRAGPVGMRSRWLMTVALRLMGNLVTEEDRDAVAGIWRFAGRGSLLLDQRPPFAA
jgi:geranylgeranyl reductase family protein